MAKILMFIDSLGSGGAQRQLVNLAIAFNMRGLDVSIMTYHQSDFFLSEVQERDIPIIAIEAKNYFLRVVRCRKMIRTGEYDVVIAFLVVPSFIAELAGFPFRRWKTIVGERSSSPAIVRTWKGRFFRLCHFLADWVVCNSYHNASLVKKANPLLPNRKIKVIYNSYDLDTLSPERYVRQRSNLNKRVLLVVASNQYLKNLKNLALAVALLSEEDRGRLRIVWYGRKGNDGSYDANLFIIKTYGITDVFEFHDASTAVYQAMVDADIVGLFSIYEGLPNTLCEAMCLGRPIMGTNVSDNALLIQHKQLLSEATDPMSIKESLSYMLSLSNDDLSAMGKINREKALELFDEKDNSNKYLEL